MEKWLKENEGRDLIRVVHNFKKEFGLTDKEAYEALKLYGYI
jgi:hypothetical protein